MALLHNSHKQEEAITEEHGTTPDGRKTPPQPHHYDAPEKMVRGYGADEDMPEDDVRDVEGGSSGSLFELGDFRKSEDDLQKSTDSIDRPKTPVQPHHYDLPEKHVDNGSNESLHSGKSIKSGSEDAEFITPPKIPVSPHHHDSPDKTIYPPGSRPSSSRSTDSKLMNERPKTPVAPHHFDSPERTIRPQQDPLLPRLARTGRIPEEYYVVGKLLLDARALLLGDKIVYTK